MVRISLGVISLVISVLSAANALGLLPDRDGAVLQGRKVLSETLAIECSLAVQEKQLPLAEAAVRAVAQRDPDLESVGLRSAAGELLIEVGDHRGPWEAGAEARSTPTHVRVPVTLDGRPWGVVELRFRPLRSGALAFLLGPIFPLAVFVLVCGFLTTYFYLRAVLRHADPDRAKVIPERVRATLNTIAEGVLVLDRDQHIALANDAFAHTSPGCGPPARWRPRSAPSWGCAPCKAACAGCRSTRRPSSATTAPAAGRWPPSTT